MLGKLAKWLRVMGCDVAYQRTYSEKDLALLMAQGRRLLSRRIDAQALGASVILIRSDHVGEQLRELKRLGCLEQDRSRFFTRCLRCNVPLQEADFEKARAGLPDYVTHKNPSGIRWCPGCGRFFWPGTHRQRMLRQLEDWGF